MIEKSKLKTPISYYGGKQTMLRHILPLIPAHISYTEAFAGGLALLFAKEPSELETVNDVNGELINFYQVCKTDFNELAMELHCTLHSRSLHEYSDFIYNHPWHFSKIERAKALWILSKMSFASKLDGSFGYDKAKNSMPKKIDFAIQNFDDKIWERLRRVTIECTDALRIISSRDTKDTFHFVDPPYIGSDLGHYKGYTEYDFEQLLKLLTRIQGKFMLTMFPHSLLENYIKEYGWRVIEVERTISASRVSRRKQVELIVMNY